MSGPPSSQAKAREEALEHKIDEEVEESFPASDPPAFMGGAAAAGAPPNKTVETKPGK